MSVKAASFLQLNVDKRAHSIGLVHDSIKRNEFDFYMLQEPFSKKIFWSCSNSKNYKLFTSVPFFLVQLLCVTVDLIPCCCQNSPTEV